MIMRASNIVAMLDWLANVRVCTSRLAMNHREFLKSSEQHTQDFDARFVAIHDSVSLCGDLIVGAPRGAAAVARMPASQSDSAAAFACLTRACGCCPRMHA